MLLVVLFPQFLAALVAATLAKLMQPVAASLCLWAVLSVSPERPSQVPLGIMNALLAPGIPMCIHRGPLRQRASRSARLR